jgi:hypothetical protein
MVRSIIPNIDLKDKTILGNPIEQRHQFAWHKQSVNWYDAR